MNKCIYCGKEISKKSNRCKSCSNSQRIYSEETKRKISESRLGDKNPVWKGDSVGYFAIHEWVNKHKKKPELCEECKAKAPRDLANISGKYLRDLNDWEYLCRSCHMKKDGRITRLHNINRLMYLERIERAAQ